MDPRSYLGLVDRAWHQQFIAFLTKGELEPGFRAYAEHDPHCLMAIRSALQQLFFDSKSGDRTIYDLVNAPTIDLEQLGLKIKLLKEASPASSQPRTKTPSS